MTCPMQTSVGPYLLDALEPEEAETMRQHIAVCEVCRAEEAILSSVPPLLRMVDLADIEEIEAMPTAPPPVVLEGSQRSMQTARRSRRSRRRRTVLLAAVAAALFVIGAPIAVGVGVVGNDHVSRPVAVSTVAPHSRVSAAVTMSARSWGTELHLKLSGVAGGERCSLVARGRDGRKDIAATWIASYEGTATVPGATAIPRNQLSGLDVMSAHRHLIVRIVVPPRAK